MTRPGAPATTRAPNWFRALGVGISVSFVVAVAVLVLASAHGSTDYWSVAVPGVLTGCGTLALAAVTYLVLRGDQKDRRARETAEQTAAERDRRSHAESIAAWYSGDYKIETSGNTVLIGGAVSSRA